jgi:hypothetical protein
VADPRKPPPELLFGRIVDGKLVVDRLIRVRSAAADYLTDALALDAGNRARALVYSFRFLEDADPEVASDAFTRLIGADYQDLRAAARGLPADTLIYRLQNPNIPANRRSLRGLYALLLGHCGADQHARLLRCIIDEDRRQEHYSALENMLVALTMLKPREGWALVRSILQDGRGDYQLRRQGLWAAGFFWDKRPDLVDRKDLVDGLCLLLSQGDIADHSGVAAAGLLGSRGTGVGPGRACDPGQAGGAAGRRPFCPELPPGPSGRRLPQEDARTGPVPGRGHGAGTPSGTGTGAGPADRLSNSSWQSRSIRSR